MSDPEVYALDVDYDFIMHCAVPDSWQIFRDEYLAQDLIEDEIAIRVYNFQLDHQRDHGVIASPSVIEHEFKSDGVHIVAPQTAAGDLVERLRERYVNNKGRNAVLDLTKQISSDPGNLAKAMLEEGRRLYGILTPRGKTFGVNDFDKAIQRYHKSVVQGRGPSMGFTELDDYFYGQRGLTFMIGAPKSYKSWFTIKAVYENICNGGFPYLYSLELPAEETDMRLRCLAAKVPYWKYLQHQLDSQDVQALDESSDILKSWGNFAIEKPQSGDRGVHSLIERARDAGADSIFVDQLQYVENSKGVAVGATNDTKDYFEVINHFRDHSDAGPIWCVHQFNRSIMNAESMPEMQQAKGSAAVEECATLALGLWANKEMRKSNLIQIGTLTSRNYGHQAWEAQVTMKSTCGIKIIGKVEDE